MKAKAVEAAKATEAAKAVKPSPSSRFVGKLGIFDEGFVKAKTLFPLNKPKLAPSKAPAPADTHYRKAVFEDSNTEASTVQKLLLPEPEPRLELEPGQDVFEHFDNQKG